ncbi:MAG: flagellar basal body rod protein FlgB [Oscillospiraceae bacterium]|nr:flagellar basal body rod protein FlgB [Oscillospiraceae bacterium]
MKLFGNTAFRVAEQGISIMKEQNVIIGHNISNATTPGYKTKYLYFEGILRDKIDNPTHKYQKELSIGTAVYIDQVTKGQPDGNNVDNDTQQALFVKNRLHYDALINQINAEFELLRTAMRRN